MTTAMPDLFNIDEKYLFLIQAINKYGTHFEGRNGGTKAIIDSPIYINWNASKEFPIVSIRKQNINHYINEFLWEINGGCNVNDLNNKYAPVDSRFLWEPWAGPNGHIPYSYGSCWRANGEILANHSVDQLKMIEDLLSKDPKNRRMTLITADVAKNAITADPDNISFGTQYPAQVPPCHPVITFTSDGTYLNANIHSRSQDVVCGLPGDMIRYNLMMQCLAHTHKLKPGNIWICFSNIHYYKEHEEKLMKVVEEFTSHPENNPSMHIKSSNQTCLKDYKFEDFTLKGYKPRKFVSFPLIV